MGGEINIGRWNSSNDPFYPPGFNRGLWQLLPNDMTVKFPTIESNDNFKFVFIRIPIYLILLTYLASLLLIWLLLMNRLARRDFQKKD